MDNNQHIPQAIELPRVTKETKNKIRVEFDRSPLVQRLKAKFLSTFFLTKVVWYFFRLILLLGISYIILFPFFAKISGSFMSMEDFVDVTVRLVPKNWTLDTYKAIIVENRYLQAFSNTLLLSLSTALIQTFICCFVGYGLAKFRFRGNKLILFLVVFTMIVPHRTIQVSLKQAFQYFDIFGILQAVTGGTVKLTGRSYLPYVKQMMQQQNQYRS